MPPPQLCAGPGDNEVVEATGGHLVTLWSVGEIAEIRVVKCGAIIDGI